jgi:hypothetical protein
MQCAPSHRSRLRFNRSSVSLIARAGALYRSSVSLIARAGALYRGSVSLIARAGALCRSSVSLISRQRFLSQQREPDLAPALSIAAT